MTPWKNILHPPEVRNEDPVMMMMMMMMIMMMMIMMMNRIINITGSLFLTLEHFGAHPFAS